MKKKLRNKLKSRSFEKDTIALLTMLIFDGYTKQALAGLFL